MSNALQRIFPCGAWNDADLQTSTVAAPGGIVQPAARRPRPNRLPGDLATMSMVETTCQQCHESLLIDLAWMGRLVECPHCGKPTPATPSPPPPADTAAPPIIKAERAAETKPVPEAVEEAEAEERSLSPTEATAKEEPQAEQTKRAGRPLPSWKQRANERRWRTQLVAVVAGIILLAAAVLLLSLG